MSRFGLGFVASPGVPGNDSFTKILLHFDGANGSTTFTDVNAGGSAHTWTSPAASVVSTVDPKFGIGSLLPNNSQIQTSSHSDFSLGTNDFTADFWVNPRGSSAGGNQGLCGQGGSSLANSSFYIYRDNSNKVRADAYSGSTLIGLTSSTTITGSSWVHVEYGRSGNTFRLFVNGNLEATTTSASSLNTSTDLFGVAGAGGALPNYSNISVDEFRLSVGIARHTANFTPPGAPYI